MKKAKWVALLLVLALCVGMLAGCGGAGDGRRIIRIGHNQATTHPTHIGLLLLLSSSTTMSSWAASMWLRSTPLSCSAPRPRWSS